MRIGGYRFHRPGPWPLLATLVLFPVLVALGFWQLDRAAQRAALEDAYESRDQRPTVDLNREDPPADTELPYNAEVAGRYRTQRQLLLDNQTSQGEVGYHVLTPLQITGRDAVILVDRGWVPAGDDRDELPAIPGPDDAVTITGHLDDGPATGLRLGAMTPDTDGWPLRIQYLDFTALEERLDMPLHHRVLRLDPNAEHGFRRDWGPAFREGYGPERNRGYAVQWFALAATLLIVFVIVNLRRESS
ncbi:MAG: SURF1 family protein [Ectothiorhodospiraceae bacterium]